MSDFKSEFKLGWGPLFAATIGTMCGLLTLTNYTQGFLCWPRNQRVWVDTRSIFLELYCFHVCRAVYGAYSWLSRAKIRHKGVRDDRPHRPRTWVCPCFYEYRVLASLVCQLGHIGRTCRRLSPYHLDKRSKWLVC